MMFPNFASTDFGEFVQEPSLERDKKEPMAKSKPTADLLTDDDLKFIGDVFIDIMFKYSRCNYYKPLSKVEFSSENYQINFVATFQSKLNVAHQLIQRHKYSLSSTIDDRFYGGIGLLINTIQNKYRTHNQLNCEPTKPYNFYKDSNIPEVYNTAALLHSIEARVSNELKEWPDHAVLNDVSITFYIHTFIHFIPSTLH